MYSIIRLAAADLAQEDNSAHLRFISAIDAVHKPSWLIVVFNVLSVVTQLIE